MDKPVSTYMPILSNRDTKLQQEEDRIRQLMQDPQKVALINMLANELEKNFNSSTKIITDIRVGAIFYCSLTKKRYAYEYIAQPFSHPVVPKVVMREAKKPFIEFDPDQLHMVMYEADSNPSPRYFIPAIDFCKYFAIGVWQLVDPNNAEEKAFLNKVQN